MLESSSYVVAPGTSLIKRGCGSLVWARHGLLLGSSIFCSSHGLVRYLCFLRFVRMKKFAYYVLCRVEVSLAADCSYSTLCWYLVVLLQLQTTAAGSTDPNPIQM